MFKLLNWLFSIKMDSQLFDIARLASGVVGIDLKLGFYFQEEGFGLIEGSFKFGGGFRFFRFSSSMGSNGSGPIVVRFKGTFSSSKFRISLFFFDLFSLRFDSLNSLMKVLLDMSFDIALAVSVLKILCFRFLSWILGRMDLSHT